MKPKFRNLFMKKLTRERVVPTISASLLDPSMPITPTPDTPELSF